MISYILMLIEMLGSEHWLWEVHLNILANPLKRKGGMFKLCLVLAAWSAWSGAFAQGQVTAPSTQVGMVATTEGSFLTALPAATRNNATLAVGFQFQVSQLITVT